MTQAPPTSRTDAHCLLQPTRQQIPTTLHLGSGKSFREDCLNVDVNQAWQPDIVADLNEAFPGGEGSTGTYQTDRFGLVTIGPSSFDEVVATDVLEHLRDLPTAMKSCLDVLKPDGVFRISVPHELSLGAWSDPTHVRAFNERSWIYYTEWFWYFGWTRARFDLQTAKYEASEFGQQLQSQGKSIEELLRTPRAVDSIYVELRKVMLTEAERDLMRAHHARRQPTGPNTD